MWYPDLNAPHADDLRRVAKCLLLQSGPVRECDCGCPCNCLVIESFGLTVRGIEIRTRGFTYRMVCWRTCDPIPRGDSARPEPTTGE